MSEDRLDKLEARLARLEEAIYAFLGSAEVVRQALQRPLQEPVRFEGEPASPEALAEYYGTSADPDCDDPDCKGWEVFNDSEDTSYLGEIQRCDDCKQYPNDEMACAAARRAGYLVHFSTCDVLALPLEQPGGHVLFPEDSYYNKHGKHCRCGHPTDPPNCSCCPWCYTPQGHDSGPAESCEHPHGCGLNREMEGPKP